MTSYPKSTPNTADREFKSGPVLTIAAGHFVHDTYSSFLAPLLPLVIDKLSISLTLAGLLAACMQIPSLLNPFIGYLADKLRMRFLVIVAPALTATMVASMGLAPDYPSLVVIFLVAGLSIAVFHSPAPAMVARVSGNRVGRGMSLFMAAGELGRTVGPLFAVWAVSVWTLEGLYRAALFGWVATAILYLRFRSVELWSKVGYESLRGGVS